MDFKDISSRFKKNKENQRSESAPAAPVSFSESYRIRGKMIGVLLRDARQNSGRTVEECARLLRVSAEQMEAWEFGDAVPSLPQLEILAYFLDVPISHFWGMDTLSADGKGADAQTEYMALRDRMVGALLRQAREEAQISAEDLSEVSGISVAQLDHYELGEISIPMHELSVLAGGVRKNMSYFLEGSSHIGKLLTMREEWQHFSQLPEDIRKFAADPLNLGFLEIAIMFREMPTDKLRRVAESMLDITM